ncbi:hypothetical protein [Fulvivirga sp.]|uniref:hypothetical protein n=1 Tax=Fulvivirga sp. TaxID=1931237 RepID=UPI0032ECBDED
MNINYTKNGLGILTVLFALSIFASRACGQLTQTERYEIDITHIGGNYQVVTCDEGVLIWSLWNIKNSLDTLALKVHFLDTNLTEKWSENFAWNRHIKLIDQQSYGAKVYILFKNYNADSNDFELLETDVVSGNILVRTINNELPFTYLDMRVTDKAVLIGGYTELSPIVIYKNFSEPSAKILPGIYGHKIEMNQLNLNPDATVEVLTAGKGKMGNRGLYLNNYNKDAQLISTAKIKPPDYRHILTSGIKTEINTSSSLVAGTFSKQNLNYPQGIYIAKLNQQSQETIKLYDYTDLDNFFNYLPEKKEQSLRRRAKHKEMQEKSLKHVYNLDIHRFFNYKDVFILYGSVSTTRKRSFTHNILLAFDEDGNLLWDKRFEAQPTSLHTSLKEERLNLLYTFEDKIYTIPISDDGKPDLNESIESMKLHYGDKLRSNEIKGIGRLNNDTYIVCGIQSLKNKEKKGADRNRTVLFINKLVLE